jgi:excisionase family DNA binding protein
MSEPLSLSPEGAAEYLSLSKPTIYRLLAAGTITGKRAGARTLVCGKSVRSYYTSLPDFVSGTPAPNAPQSTPARRRRKVRR